MDYCPCLLDGDDDALGGNILGTHGAPLAGGAPRSARGAGRGPVAANLKIFSGTSKYFYPLRLTSSLRSQLGRGGRGLPPPWPPAPGREGWLPSAQAGVEPSSQYGLWPRSFTGRDPSAHTGLLPSSHRGLGLPPGPL